MEETLKAHAQYGNSPSASSNRCASNAPSSSPSPTPSTAMALPPPSPTFAPTCPCPTMSRHVRCLMRLLSHEGLFASHVTPYGEEAFDLTSVSRFLRSSSIHCFSPFVRFILDRHLVDSSQLLAGWLRRKDVATSPFEITHGKSFWDMNVERPKLNRIFNSAIESDSSFLMDIVTHVGGEVFRGIGSLVDAGGGTGFTAAKLVEAFPGLRCIVFDLPHVIATALRASAAIEFVSGDMSSRSPAQKPPCLKWILHAWNDEEYIKILKRCKEAIPPREKGGKVIIIDVVAGMSVDDT